MKLAPICLFTYNRLDETKQTVTALQQNFLAQESELFIFSDGGKNKTAHEKVEKVRTYLKTITGFKKVEIIESPTNKGLANSIITGVTKILENYETVIVLEDDLVTTPNFLDFMNQALEFYTVKEQIFTISGYTMDLPTLKTTIKDYYLGHRASSWGWATWKNRWDKIDWNVKDYDAFKKDVFAIKKFKRGGSDLFRMLRNQMKGKIDSWAIRWCYHQYKYDLLTVFATKSKLKSIGFGEAATHTKVTKRFFTDFDKTNTRSFSFDNEVIIDKKLVKEFKSKFSIINRLKDRF
ncbi:glycosyltransferase family 2 protein [Wenyingzhuangia sp. IMCC45467]